MIIGPVTGTVVEASGVANATPGTPIATGDLTAIDVDNPDDAWTGGQRPAPPAPMASAPTLVSAAGVWTCTLDT